LRQVGLEVERRTQASECGETCTHYYRTADKLLKWGVILTVAWQGWKFRFREKTEKSGTIGLARFPLVVIYH